MPQVPTDFAPNQTPSEGSVGRQDINVNGNTFGGGLAAGLSDIGDAYEKQGDMLAQHAVTLQNIDNKASSDNAYVNLMTQANSLLYGDGKTPGYSDLQGKNAVDAFPKARDTLLQIRENVAGTLPNKATQLLFDADSRRLTANFLSSMSTHAAQQQRQYVTDTHAGMIDAAQSNAVLNYKTPGAVDNALNIQAQAIAQEGVVQGKPPQWVMNQTELAKSKTYSDVAKRIAVDDPFAGQDYFHQHMGDLTAADQVSLGQYFHSVTQPAAAWNIATNVINGGHVVAAKDFDDAIVNVGEHGKVGQVSPAGALGPGQIMPATAAAIAQKAGIPFDADKLKNDPAYNKQIRLAYENELLQRFGGNQVLAAAAYNAGPGVVNDWIYGTNNSGKNQSLLRLGDPVKGETTNAAFMAQIPFQETKDYAQRVSDSLGQQSGVALTSYDVKDHLGDLVAAGANAATYAQPGQPIFSKLVEENIRNQVGVISQMQTAQRVEANGRLSTIVMGGPTGAMQKPRSWGEFTQINPNWQEDWQKLKPAEQGHLLNMIANNGSGKSVQPSQESMLLNAKLIGESISNPHQFLAENFNSGPNQILPYADRRALMDKQATLASRPQPNEDILHAVSIANDMGLSNVVDKNTDAHNMFVGRLSTDIDTFNAVHGRKPNDSDIQKMVTGLMLTTKSHVFGANDHEFESAYAGQISQIPTADRAAIVQAYSNHYGHEPSAGQIVYYYGKKHGQP